MKMSEWRAERNRRSVKRLTKALPPMFPAPVLTHALGRPFIPPTPRHAVDAYWRTHPVRADRLARWLATQSGAPAGWNWSLDAERANGQAASFRMPPAPYREGAFNR